MKKEKGFTLAEVLITIGLIGAVAIMVVPTLKQNIENRILASKTKHAYSLIMQAAGEYMVSKKLTGMDQVQDCISNECTAGAPSIEDFVESTLNYRKKCTTVKSCFYDTFLLGDTDVDVNTYATTHGQGVAYTLNDGYAILLDKKEGSKNIRVTIDVNGEGQPNEFGRDVWAMYIDKNGTVIPSSAGDGDSCDDNYNVCFSDFVNNGFKFKSNEN